MELKLLRAFVQLSNTGHYGIAAAQLFVSQSTLSKQIQSLERHVGGHLFERGRHGAKLTPLGGILLKEADRLLKLSDEVDSKLKRAKSGTAGHLDMGFGLTTLEVAPRLIAAFRKKVPDCEITLNDMPSSEQQSKLRDRTLDLGFCREPSDDNLEFQPVVQENLALVLPRDHPLPTNDQLSDLNRLGFIALRPERGAGLAAQIGQWCQQARFEPRVVQIADDILTIHSVVAAGLGVALLPMTGVSALGDQTERYPLQGAASSWPVGLCWRRDEANQLVLRFVDFVSNQSLGND